MSVDLQAAIFSPFGRYQNAVNNAIHKEAHKIRMEGDKLIFQWIPSHIHIADDLDTTGRLQTQIGITTVDNIGNLSREILAEINGHKMKDPLSDIKTTWNITSTI